MQDTWEVRNVAGKIGGSPEMFSTSGKSRGSPEMFSTSVMEENLEVGEKEYTGKQTRGFRRQ